MRKEINHILIIFLSFLLKSFYSRLINHKTGIAYGLDNQYTYPTIVSITSILENASSHTYYIFYLLVDKKTFKKENKEKFENLEKRYER